jgi:hypothetical protein
VLLDFDCKFWLFATHFTVGSNNTKAFGTSDPQQAAPKKIWRLPQRKCKCITRGTSRLHVKYYYEIVLSRHIVEQNSTGQHLTRWVPSYTDPTSPCRNNHQVIHLQNGDSNSTNFGFPQNLRPICVPFKM